MLSNPTPPSNLHLRQRQHRRQNSTPTAFEAVKIAGLPNIQRQRHANQVSHRRGLSLDTRRLRLSPTTATTTIGQDFTTVSTSTANKPGLASTPQHVLRESQQQRAARPGIGQPTLDMLSQDGENYLLSPQGTPQSQRFHGMLSQGANSCMAMPFDTYSRPVNVVKKNQQGFIANHDMGSEGLEFFGPDSAVSTPTFLTFEEGSPSNSYQQGWLSEGETARTRRTSRRVSNGIMDRVAKYESMAMDGTQRPATPPNQNVSAQDYFPPTPMETPQIGTLKAIATNNNGGRIRFSDGYDESMEETIRPGRNNRKSNRAADLFAQMEHPNLLPGQQAIPTPPRSHTFPNGQAFAAAGLVDEFINLDEVDPEFSRSDQRFDAMGFPQAAVAMSPNDSQQSHRSHHSQYSQHSHHSQHSQHSTPMTPQTTGFATLAPRPDLGPPNFGMQGTTSNNFNPASRKDSPHRRTESLASIASNASIASLDLASAKTDTGVSQAAIDAYIDGPDAANKWTCTYEGCDKKFGRKENIKSHIQTHLNDRQFECPICQSRFVRQHDLKRHAKIHTGCKPYECACGNTFARHDALTRHRQRGMCIGAFEGIVRKPVKRGRPRKSRPDTDERREKRKRTRRQNQAAAAAAESSSTSSHSEYSDSSAANSPSADFDDLMDEHEFDQKMSDLHAMDIEVSMQSGLGLLPSVPTSATMNPGNLIMSTAPLGSPEPIQFGGVPEVLAVLSPDHAVSPSALSNHSHHSHVSAADGLDGLPRVPGSPAKSVASHFTPQPGTPPELSASSSPPPAQFFDLEPNSSGLVDPDSSLGLITTAAHNLALTATASGNIGNVSLDGDMLLEAFTNEDGLVSISQEGFPGGHGAKFGDDEFEASMGMNMHMFGEDSYYANP